MAAKSKSPKDSSAHLGFEATARRGSANPKGEAIPRSLEGNPWFSADSRNAVEIAPILHFKKNGANCCKQPEG